MKLPGKTSLAQCCLPLLSLALLLGPPLPAAAQYRGMERPLPRAETLDSLAALTAGLDSLRSASALMDSDLQAQHDSLAAASEAADSTHAARIDSVIAHPGGGSGAPADTALYLAGSYDYILGWDGSPEETHTFARAAGRDSITGDTLWALMNRLGAGAGGRILIKPVGAGRGDTVWIGGDKTLAAAWTANVELVGIGRNSVIAFTKPGNILDRDTAVDTIRYRGLALIGSQAATATTYYGNGIDLPWGVQLVEDCYLWGNGAPGGWQFPDAGATMICYRNCELYAISWGTQSQAAQSGAVQQFVNCTGSLGYSRPSVGEYYFTGGNLELYGGTYVYWPHVYLNGVTLTLRADWTQSRLMISGGSIRSASTSQRTISGVNLFVTGGEYEYITFATADTKNHFHGCNFFNGTLALDINHGDASVRGCAFNAVTTCLDVAASLADVFVRNNNYGGETTWATIGGGATVTQSDNDNVF